MTTTTAARVGTGEPGGTGSPVRAPPGSAAIPAAGTTTAPVAARPDYRADDQERRGDDHQHHPHDDQEQDNLTHP
ncbi:hypothetical protein [Nocardia brasiliensis]|uniref:hypothetical protein n=1 Tax=Nocardia brasiliensis TaxID=37326 RepID=UPI003672213A